MYYVIIKQLSYSLIIVLSNYFIIGLVYYVIIIHLFYSIIVVQCSQSFNLLKNFSLISVFYFSVLFQVFDIFQFQFRLSFTFFSFVLFPFLFSAVTSFFFNSIIIYNLSLFIFSKLGRVQSILATA